MTSRGPALCGASLAALLALAACGQEQEQQPRRPSVVLVSIDTLRADHLGLYGYERDNTPVLEEFAARSVVFDRAITPAPWTLAAHGSMFTGHMPWELSAGWTVPLDDTHPTLAEYLTGRGYASAAFVANYIYGPPAFGLARGFTHYRFYPLNAGIVLTHLVLDHNAGDGIQLADGPAVVEVVDVTILSSGRIGIRCADDATVRIANCRIEDSGTRGDDRQGYAILRQRRAQGGAPQTITLLANTFASNRGRIVAGKSDVDLGNYDQMLDPTDSQAGY